MVGKHENVAELLGVYEDQRNVYLVLELCLGGELFDRIVSKGTFSEKMVRKLLRFHLEYLAFLRCTVLQTPLAVYLEPPFAWYLASTEFY